MTKNFPSPTGLYKILNADLTPRMGSGLAYVVGKRRSVCGKLAPCENGLHACALEQLPRWVGPSIHPVLEASAERIDDAEKTVLRSLVIGPAYPTWNERTLRLWACDCAEHVLPLFERRRPGDTRPREAIAVARRYASGEATIDELRAARRAADAAAAADAYAAYAAAAAAAAYAADAAAYAAYAAYAADTAGAAARREERAWQAERLAQYLSGEIS